MIPARLVLKAMLLSHKRKEKNKVSHRSCLCLSLLPCLFSFAFAMG
jgi:hypothetical protein